MRAARGREVVRDELRGEPPYIVILHDEHAPAEDCAARLNVEIVSANGALYADEVSGIGNYCDGPSWVRPTLNRLLGSFRHVPTDEHVTIDPPIRPGADRHRRKRCLHRRP